MAATWLAVKPNCSYVETLVLVNQLSERIELDVTDLEDEATRVLPGVPIFLQYVVARDPKWPVTQVHERHGAVVDAARGPPRWALAEERDFSEEKGKFRQGFPKRPGRQLLGPLNAVSVMHVREPV